MNPSSNCPPWQLDGPGSAGTASPLLHRVLRHDPLCRPAPKSQCAKRYQVSTLPVPSPVVEATAQEQVAQAQAHPHPQPQPQPSLSADRVSVGASHTSSRSPCPAIMPEATNARASTLRVNLVLSRFIGGSQGL